MQVNILLVGLFMFLFNIIFIIYLNRYYKTKINKLQRKNSSLMVELNNRQGQFLAVSRNLEAIQTQLLNALQEIKHPQTSSNTEAFLRLRKIINRVTYFSNVTKEYGS